jgi:hypothetical protein
VKTKYVEVDIDLDDFSDKDLIEELGYRGYTVSENASDTLQETLKALYEAYTMSDRDRVREHLSVIFDTQLGKII